MPRDDSGRVEIRLGDLDLKTGAGGKAKYWLDLEHQLIVEDWYAGAKNNVSESECAQQSPRAHSQSSI